MFGKKSREIERLKSKVEHLERCNSLLDDTANNYKAACRNYEIVIEEQRELVKQSKIKPLKTKTL